DGVSEASNVAGEEYGDNRIVEALKDTDADTPPAVLARLLASVRTYATGAPQSDDITAMVIRYGR
ncbi:MAG: SpoIIE family protein phosphatase, partial [Acidobacteriota bacterium]